MHKLQPERKHLVPRIARSEVDTRLKIFSEMYLDRYCVKTIIRKTII